MEREIVGEGERYSERGGMRERDSGRERETHLLLIPLGIETHMLLLINHPSFNFKHDVLQQQWGRGDRE